MAKTGILESISMLPTCLVIFLGPVVSSPEPKGQLTRNLVGNIGATCRSQLAKIVPI